LEKKVSLNVRTQYVEGSNNFKHRADTILCALGRLYIERKASLMMCDFFQRREGERKERKEKVGGRKKKRKEGMKKGKKREEGRRSRKLEQESPQDNTGKILHEASQSNEANLCLGFVSSRSRISQDQILGLKG